MFARQSTIAGKPDQIDTGIRNFNDQILPAVRQLKGFTGAQFLADRKGGKVVVTTFWETEQALRDSESKANELRRMRRPRSRRRASRSSNASRSPS